MLEKLLSEIRTGGTLEVNTLATRLQTSPQLVQAMLEHLQRAGYIRDYSSCETGCSGCALSEDCARPPDDRSPRLWQA